MTKQKSLKERIHDYVRNDGGWVPKWVIEEKSKSAGYLSETGNRRTRELVEEEKLEVKEFKGIAHYRYIKKQKTISYHEVIEDENGRRAVIREKVIYD